MYALRLALFGLLAISLSGCLSGAGEKESAGTLLGAVAGGIAGAQFGKGEGQLIATGIGTLLGAAIGNEIGKSLDRADQLAMERAAQSSLETAPVGRTTTWKNPDSGNQGTITPRKTFKRNDGTYCREFTQTITIGGRTEEAYGTACRQPDGTWKLISA